MKTTLQKITKTVLIVAFFCSLNTLFAQVPQKMSYQAVIRDASNTLIQNTTVGMKISILQTSAVGNMVFVETQTPTTNTNGLISLEIGSGIPFSGNFSTIDWANGPYFIKLETDPSGGTNYTISGTSQLLSVPFALYAANSGTSNGWGTSGNAGTTAANFIGTTDDKDVVFKRNNIVSGKIAVFNTSFGVNALNLLSSGFDNTAIGLNALKANTTGSRNSALGSYALQNNTVGSNNTATGYQTLLKNIGGDNNTALGSQALLENSTGNSNTAIGTESLRFNSTGIENTAIGYDALYINGIGSGNTATGNSSLFSNTTGNNNTANGSNALSFNTIGLNNVAIGVNSLGNNLTGNSNTATGYSALQSNQTGTRNIAFGTLSLSALTTGSFNTAIGSVSYSSGNFINSTALGDSAIITASNQVRIGDNLITSIGGFANWTNVSDARFKKDIQSNVPGLAFIKKLNPVTYHLDMDAIENFLKSPEEIREKHREISKNSKPILETGFVAQEVEQAAKDLGFDFSGVDVPKNDTDYYGLRYSEFVVPLVKAVQEQQVIIEINQTELNELKSKNTLLEQRLKALEDKLNK